MLNPLWPVIEQVRHSILCIFACCSSIFFFFLEHFNLPTQTLIITKLIDKKVMTMMMTQLGRKRKSCDGSSRQYDDIYSNVGSAVNTAIWIIMFSFCALFTGFLQTHQRKVTDLLGMLNAWHRSVTPPVSYAKRITDLFYGVAILPAFENRYGNGIAGNPVGRFISGWELDEKIDCDVTCLSAKRRCIQLPAGLS